MSVVGSPPAPASGEAPQAPPTVHGDGPEPGAAARSTRTAALLVLTAVVALLAGGGSAEFVLRTEAQPAPTQVIVRPATTSGSGQTRSTTVPSVVAADQAALVQVVRQPARGPVAAGDVSSGFIADANGLVVTDEAAVTGAVGLVVVLPDGTRAPATLAAVDADTGIVILRIPTATSLPALAFGQPPRVGEAAIALSQPIGAGPAVDVGTVSATGLVIRIPDPARSGRLVALGGALRTDAPVAAGGAGGPVVDANGHVIGILAGPGVVSAGGVSPGAGSALALDAVAAQSLVAALAASTLVPASPGVVSQPLDAASAATLGVPGGALVVAVLPGSPAATAGLAAGDVIETVDGRPVAGVPSVSDLLIQEAPIGAQALRVWRAGAIRHLTVVLPPVG